MPRHGRCPSGLIGAISSRRMPCARSGYHCRIAVSYLLRPARARLVDSPCAQAERSTSNRCRVELAAAQDSRETRGDVGWHRWSQDHTAHVHNVCAPLDRRPTFPTITTMTSVAPRPRRHEGMDSSPASVCPCSQRASNPSRARHNPQHDTKPTVVYSPPRVPMTDEICTAKCNRSSRPRSTASRLPCRCHLLARCVRGTDPRG